ncbi:MAG: helix-hairpin-helix domain-containing protein [Acholeplasmataceae bacterium]|jgi:DNA ligase (NAD+)|nr:helix-hairpin-helix domain-containing protein [Acholeplasmataceae bacterium]
MKIYIPTACPSCNTPLVWSKTETDLYCPNTEGCSGQSLYRIENFLLSHEVEEITSTTIKKLGVNTIEELYDIDDFDIAGIEGMGLKRAQVILKELEKTLNTTPEKLLKSFGIPGVGKTLSEMIMNNVGSFDELFTMTIDDFITLDGVGSVLADNIVHGLRKNKGLYNFLKDRGLKFQEKMSTNLQGKVFTLTGKSDINRNDLTKMINQHGGMVKGISKSVDYLVTNDINSTSNKTKKAKEYGTKIISYDDLMEMLKH